MTEKHYKIMTYLLIILVWVGFVWGLLNLGGCSIVGKASPITVLPKTSIGIVSNMVTSTNWVMTLFILAFAASIFAAINGLKTGWSGAAACLAGIALQGALTQTWLFWCLGVLLLVGILLAGASILRKNGALVQIIKGVQRLKRTIPDSITSKEALIKGQTAPTQKLVSKIKTDLKLKGDI